MKCYKILLSIKAKKWLLTWKQDGKNYSPHKFTGLIRLNQKFYFAGYDMLVKYDNENEYPVDKFFQISQSIPVLSLYHV